MVRELRDTKLVIDLEKIKKNIEVVKNIIGPDVAFMPVIKANGYGH
ncbi:MAG: alanine racemase, partial [Firmicutes bacterium]|nr:alanine racemase [Bacillota bacterium]